MRRYLDLVTNLVVVLVAFGALMGGSAAALAQDATPVPAETGPMLPLAPDPANWCTVSRFPRAELEAIWEEVNAVAVAEASPVTEAESLETLAGVPADAATVAAITTAVIEVIACNVNGGDGLRDPNHITEEHNRAGLVGLSREEFDAFYPEQAVSLEPEQWLMVYAVRDIRVLPDGRVACHPEIIVPGVGHFRGSLIFEKVGDRWLIEESHEGEDVYPRD